MDNLIDKAAGYLLRNHRRQRWKQIVSVLAAIVVFVTTYALILPAITFESNSDISQGEYMYPVSDEQGEKYEIADSGGESDGAQEENAASTDAQYTAAQEHTSSEDSEKPEETAEPEEAAEPSKDTQEPHGTESPSDGAGDSDGKEQAATAEPDAKDEDKTEKDSSNDVTPTISKSGAAAAVLIDGVMTDAICWTVDVTPDERTAYFLDTLNTSDGGAHTYAVGTDITVTAYREDGTSVQIICSLPGSESDFSAKTYQGDDFIINLNNSSDSEMSLEDFAGESFIGYRFEYYTVYTADEKGEGDYFNTVQLLTSDAAEDGANEQTLLAEDTGSCEIRMSELVLKENENQNLITLTAVTDEWQPVTDDDGKQQMALVMYYCTYSLNPDSSIPEGTIGGYARHQLTPKYVSGYDQAEGAGINGNSYRFEITGAYTNGTDYLIPVSYFESAYGNKTYQDGTVVCDYVYSSSALCPFIYASGDTWASNGGSNVFNANRMCAATYYRLNGENYVRITAADVAGQPYKIGVVYYTVMKKATDTYNPNSTVINLFDYWATLERKDSDNHSSSSTEFSAELNSGINENHALKFGRSIGEGYGLINYSYGGTDTPSKRMQGIVANTLGSDRFPYLSGKLTTDDDKNFMPSGTTEEQSVESLAYLFDPNKTANGKKSFPNVTGLLWQDEDGYYCYDSNLRAAELDEATCAVTEYTSPAGVYSANGVSGQFFPFNDAHRTTLINADQDPINHYFGLTLTSRFIQQFGGKKAMTSDEDVIFKFTGDNDVWVFIDNVLVADLGGLGSSASVTINFRTGEVLIDDAGTTGNPTGTQNTTIREAFIAAHPDYATSIAWNGDTFPDETLHTLKFYYLERGNFDSNLKLQYNLNQVPVSKIEKVDQYGRFVDNAVLAIYRAVENADKTYSYIGDNGKLYTSEDVKSFTINPENGNMSNSTGVVITSAFHGVTENGEMPFLSGDGMPYSMEELESMFGNKMILREVKIPEGFRTVSDEIYLSIEGGLMFCNNTYNSGVLAHGNVLVNATNQLYAAREYTSVATDMYNASHNSNDNNNVWRVGEREIQDSVSGDTVTMPIYSVNYYDVVNNAKNGTLFSVVLKRNGRDFWHGYGYDYWYPVYGTDKKGYTVVESVPGVENAVPVEPKTEEEWNSLTFDTAPTNIEAVLYAAKAQAKLAGESALTFQESGNGMQLLLEHLPGSINRYYTFMLNNELLDTSNPSDSDPQYVVAYYWTSANSIEDATAENTVRVYSHDNLISEVNGFKLQWSTTISVPNLENRLFFQKTDKESETGELVNDAIFALYDVYDAAPTKESISYGYNFIYYIGHDAATGSKVYVAPLDNAVSNPRPGYAVVMGVRTEELGNESAYVIGYGDYTVNTAATIKYDEETGAYEGLLGTNVGRITVTLTAPAKNADGGDVAPVGSQYFVDPATDADGNFLVGATHDVCTAVSETGTGHFNKLKPGCYYLREIAAPAGFTLNKEEIPVLVNQNGVYANAKSDNNGVAVGNGIGYLVSTLDAYASHGDVDETMTWVYGALIQNNAEDFSAFDDISGDVIHVEDGTATDKWYFVKPNSARDDGYGLGATDKREEAMVTYLEYADTLAEDSTKEVVFDYTPNNNQSARAQAGEKGAATLEGENMIRLFTDVGWSDLAIYQDYAYGAGQATTGRTTNYTDLTSYGNISNLFSSSTFVRVTDKPRVDLAVKKVSANDPSQTLFGAKFRLYYTDEDGKNHYYKASDSGAVGWTVNEEDATLVTDANGLVKFPDLPDGTYYLEEVSAPTGFWPIESPIALQIIDRTLQLSDSSLPVGVFSDGGVLQSSGETLYTITVPNTLNGGYELPETGGCGTIIYMVSGLLLLAAALCGYIIKRRREGRFCK